MTSSQSSIITIINHDANIPHNPTHNREHSNDCQLDESHDDCDHHYDFPNRDDYDHEESHWGCFWEVILLVMVILLKLRLQLMMILVEIKIMTLIIDNDDGTLKCTWKGSI